MGTIFISYKAYEPLLKDLADTGHEIFLVKDSGLATTGIGDHPDIYMCQAGSTLLIDDGIVTEPDIRARYEEAMLAQMDAPTETPLIPALRTDGMNHLSFNMGSIGSRYPYDVPYNAACTGKYFIHNTEFTSPVLLDLARDAGLELINVKQGYTKCSCVVVDEQAVITADKGIARRIEAYNEMLAEEGAEDEQLQCLLVRHCDIELPGFNYGFIGGTSGKMGTKIYFNGDLSTHPDFEIINDFILSRGCEPVWYEGLPLRDIGSIIYLD